MATPDPYCPIPASGHNESWIHVKTCDLLHVSREEVCSRNNSLFVLVKVFSHFRSLYNIKACPINVSLFFFKMNTFEWLLCCKHPPCRPQVHRRCFSRQPPCSHSLCQAPVAYILNSIMYTSKGLNYLVAGIPLVQPFSNSLLQSAFSQTSSRTNRLQLQHTSSAHLRLVPSR